MKRIKLRGKARVEYMKQMELFFDDNNLGTMRCYFNDVNSDIFNLLREWNTLPNENRTYCIDLGACYGTVEVTYDMATYLLDLTQIIQCLCSRIPAGLGGDIDGLKYILPKLPEKSTRVKLK